MTRCFFRRRGRRPWGIIKDVPQDHPELNGRVVIKDLPKVVGGQEGVEVIAHDFFASQPVKGMQHLSRSLGKLCLRLSNVSFYT